MSTIFSINHFVDVAKIKTAGMNQQQKTPKTADYPLGGLLFMERYFTTY